MSNIPYTIQVQSVLALEIHRMRPETRNTEGEIRDGKHVWRDLRDVLATGALEMHSLVSAALHGHLISL